jgi:hypothetical protein
MDSRNQFGLLEWQSRNSYANVTSANIPSEFLEDPSQSREARRQDTSANGAFGKRLSLNQSNNYTF